MRRLVLVLALQLLLQSRFLVPGVQAQTASNSWDPKHSWVFAVGVLESANKDLSALNQKHRRDVSIIQAFRAKGVPENHIVYLKDKDAKLSPVRSQLVKMLGQTQPGDSLFFYYCGGGWVDRKAAYFGNYDAGNDAESCLSMDTVVGDLAGFKGKNAIFAVDCSESGALVDALKRSEPAYEYGVLTSTQSGNSSTGNWTFSQALLDCLQGHVYADRNKDGATTFSELAEYIKSEMKDFEKQDCAISTSPKFDSSFKIATTTFAQEPGPQRVEALFDNQWRTAKLLETIGDQGKIRWLSIGWDGPDDEEWMELSKIRRPGAQTTLSAEGHTAEDLVSAPNAVPRPDASK